MGGGTMHGTFRSSASELRVRRPVSIPRLQPRWKAEAWTEKDLIAGLVIVGFAQAGFALLSR